MSSFTRRIQRQLSPSRPVVQNELEVRLEGAKPVFGPNPARKKFFDGRGQRLGFQNPEDKCLLARADREAKKAS